MMTKNQINSRVECAKVILNFLAWKNYSPCSVKDLLHSPPLDVLLNIWNFLFRLVDPNINITNENMAEKVPKFYNDFGYPHTMRKSQLKSPNSIHQWEYNLVALSWLCKLLMYEHENFEKDFESGSPQTAEETYTLNVSSKVNVKSALTSRTMRELSNKHFKFFLNQEKPGKEIANDVEDKINRILYKLESSVESKQTQFEKLKSDSVKLHKEIQEFEKLNERVETLSEELAKIEELNKDLKEECIQSQRQLDSLKKNLTQETDTLVQIENKNKEINENMKKKVDGKDIKNLNYSISELKVKLSNTSKKIKDLELELPSLSSNVTNLNHDLSKALASVLKTCKSISASLSSKGIDKTSWDNLEALVKSVDLTSLENLEQISESCSKVAEEAVVGETFNFKNESEGKSQYEEKLLELERTEKALKEEVAQLRTIDSELLNSTHFLEEKSHIVSHTDFMVSMIKSNSKEELDSSRRELESATNDLKAAHKRLEDEKFRARGTLRKYIEAVREIIDRAEKHKLKNSNLLKELISLQTRSLDEMK